MTSPEFEAAIEMTRQAMLHFNVPAAEVLSMASAIRHERYLQADQTGLALMSQLNAVARHLDVDWVSVPAGSPLEGRTLGELRLRATTGVSVVAIVREGALTSNPDGNVRLERGDLVAVMGTRDQTAAFAALRLGKPGGAETAAGAD